MTTMLEKKTAAFIAEHGGKVVHSGITGGAWYMADCADDGRLVAHGMERNNLAAWIREHPDSRKQPGYGGHIHILDRHAVILGAIHGGGRCHVAKQRYYNVVKF